MTEREQTHHKPETSTECETVCWWDSKKYGVGSIVKQDDGKCHRCAANGEWDAGQSCGN